jgi:hypothetical protein
MQVTQRNGDSDQKVLIATVEHVVNQQVILARLERQFSPKPATLVPHGSDSKELEQRMGRLVAKLGGPPLVGFIGVNDPKPRFDLFPRAALHEVVNMFHRTRRSVTRAHVALIGSHFVHQKPEVFSLPENGDVKVQFLEAIESEFWELTETAYIRLASYWDRVGQLLDFVFFGIRQFDRDGFTAIVDRMRNNLVPVDTVLSSLPAWNSLRAFQQSEKEDGLKWLLRRRNLLVHSLYLRPIGEAEDREIFDSEFNHLDASLRKKLAPGVRAWRRRAWPARAALFDPSMAVWMTCARSYPGAEADAPTRSDRPCSDVANHRDSSES